jgi:UDP-N-acetylmuramate--alanine ligase
VPYGRTAEGDYRIVREELGEGYTRFSLAGGPASFLLKIPGEHNVLNAAAAVALCTLLWRRERAGADPVDIDGVTRALAGFTGSRRRSEIVGEAGGILFMDDYAHHPTAIATTLAGLRRFHPRRRIIVDFMSHTYSRTQALLPAFGGCFGAADMVILHRIYASARERNDGGITGRMLFDEVSRSHAQAHYFENPLEAVPFLLSELKAGDLFLTMGAGDNWRLGRELIARVGNTGQQGKTR